MTSFRSDNNAGVCPEALAAMNEAAAGSAVGYGDDDWTARATAAMTELFGDDARVFFVATGTAANTLAIAALSEPWERTLCYEQSHLNDDESTAPERVSGCRLTTVAPAAEWSSKMTPADLERAAAGMRGDVHQPQPGVFSLSNITELGEVYTETETAELAAMARSLGYRVHVDGARFANAVAARMRATDRDAQSIARALTIDAGVDVLSFGGTKNGLALGEAIVFFPQGGSIARSAHQRLPYLRKSFGHLLSKHRFVTAPFARTLEDGSWLRHAVHANAMGQRLADGAKRLGYEIPFSPDASAVFLRLSPNQHEALQARGHGYYPFGPARWNVYRLMAAFDTEPEHVDALLADLAGVAQAAGSRVPST
jgi:threonine aldolase